MNPSKIFFQVSKYLKSFAKSHLRKSSSSASSPRDPVVTILDAYTKVGRALALLLKQSPYVGELRLHDNNSNICTVAEDLSHIDTRTKIKSFGGKTAMKYALLDADVVIAVGGCRTSHKEDVKQIFERNVYDVRLTALHMVEFNPKAVLCLAKPPIEAMVPLVSEEYKKAGVYDSRKIIGITSMATMKANYHIAAATGKNAANILCPIVGGISNNCLVGVISQAKPDLNMSSQKQCQIQECLANDEDDLLKLYADCGTICLAPALAISRFINLVIRALKGDANCVECAFVRQTGHIGHFLPYMASIVRLGRQGVLSSHMPKVSGEEGQRLKIASYVIKDLINMGESFVTGEIKPDPHKQHRCNLNHLNDKGKQEPEVNKDLLVKKEAKVVQ